MDNEDLNPNDRGPNSVPTIGGLPTFREGTFQSGVIGTEKNNLMYPLGMNSSQDRIFITQIEYKRTDIIQQESNFLDREKMKSLGSVILPMPNDISETNSVGWGEDSLSNVAAAAMPNLLGAVIGAAGGNVTKATQDALDAIINTVLASGNRAEQFLATKAAASVIQKFGVSVNPDAYISRATSAAINPNLELLFQGPKLRQFGFQFKMTPRSQKEAAEIRRILRFFKKGMSPKRGSSTNTDASFFLGAPNVFKIQFKSGNSELKSIGRIKTCALVSFNTNYTPDGFYAAYNDSSANGSQPIAVTMQMGFTELTPVFNDEYSDEYSDEVGPNEFGYTRPTPETSSPPPGDPEFIGPVLGSPAERAEARQRALGVPTRVGQNSGI